MTEFTYDTIQKALSDALEYSKEGNQAMTEFMIRRASNYLEACYDAQKESTG